MSIKSKIWWGAPRNFSTEIEDRKISWMELFYDLVYVIAISKINSQLAENLSISGLLDFLFLFSIIFWGWLNGSLYHDLHGAEGLRTRLMTLWQMMIVAGLVITLESVPESQLFNLTIALIVMQLYITYMWWSVGVYDKAHRKLNRPYTVLYLASFVLMFSSLFLNDFLVKIFLFIVLILNYLPPILTHFIERPHSREFRLSSSMSERLGLFTIIIFGEVVLGVISGTIEIHELNFSIWLNFGLGVSIVFSLWWIFFTLLSDPSYKKGIFNSSLVQFVFLPTLMALSLIGIGFSKLFESFSIHEFHSHSLKMLFGFALSAFLAGINVLLFLIEYPAKYQRIKRWAQFCLLVATLFFVFLGSGIFELPIFFYLLTSLLIILALIFVLNFIWYRIVNRNNQQD